jgi:hypothetical protein
VKLLLDDVKDFLPLAAARRWRPSITKVTTGRRGGLESVMDNCYR